MPDMRFGRPRQRRILVIIRHPLGGVRTHILYTYPTLMEAGYRFTFVIPEGPAHAPFRADVGRWEGTEVFDVPCRESNRFRAQFVPTVRTLLRRRDFALIHSHGLRAAIPTMLANARRRLPHVMTSHDVFCHAQMPGVFGWLKFRALEQMLRRLDVLIAVGNDARDDLLSHLPALRNGPCRVLAIPNGIDLPRHEPRGPTGTLREQLGLPAQVSLLGFLGRFMPQKGFLPLVDALSVVAADPRAGRFHLLAVGSGDFVREYKAEVERRDELRGRVTFREHLPDVAPILRELDLLVIPSLWEACPILPMEALASGIPVLGSDCIGLREVLRDTPARTVPANDPAALAEALGRAIDCPWKEDATGGIFAARRRFDVRQRALDLLKVLDSCIPLPPQERQPAGESMCSGSEAS